MEEKQILNYEVWHCPTSVFMLLEFPSLGKNKGEGDRNFPMAAFIVMFIFLSFFLCKNLGMQGVSAVVPLVFHGRLCSTNQSYSRYQQQTGISHLNLRIPLVGVQIPFPTTAEKVLVYSEHGGDFCYTKGHSNQYKVLLFDKYIQ